MCSDQHLGNISLSRRCLPKIGHQERPKACHRPAVVCCVHRICCSKWGLRPPVGRGGCVNISPGFFSISRCLRCWRSLRLSLPSALAAFHGLAALSSSVFCNRLACTLGFSRRLADCLAILRVGWAIAFPGITFRSRLSGCPGPALWWATCA